MCVSPPRTKAEQPAQLLHQGWVHGGRRRTSTCDANEIHAPGPPVSSAHHTMSSVDGAGASEEGVCPACTPETRTARAATIEWVACSHCDAWFHCNCVGVEDAGDYAKWYCGSCLADASLGLQNVKRPPRRRSRRDRPATDYAAIQEGRPPDPLGRWALYLERCASLPRGAARVSAETWTQAWLDTDPRAWTEPTVVPAGGSPEQPGDHIAGMVVPGRTTSIRQIAELVGRDTQVEVIDVNTQMSSNAWTLEEWADYFETPAAEREKVLNIISLEVSGTPLERLIQAPAVVAANDWVERDWPRDRRPPGPDASRWPKVQRYVLMGVENAFTDFHIDFAGSYVYYHVVWGRKVFLFAPPTPANLAAYRAWTSSSHQETVWLGDTLQRMSRVEISQGETMIIPSGWIHAVHTPCDTLVIGGNFLSDYDVAMHWRIEELEIATRVPRKFRFPHLMRLTWYVAHGWRNRLQGKRAAQYPTRVLHGVQQLCRRLDTEVQRLDLPEQDGEEAKKSRPQVQRRAAHDALPRDVVSDPHALLSELRTLVAEELGRREPDGVDKPRKRVKSEPPSERA